MDYRGKPKDPHRK